MFSPLSYPGAGFSSPFRKPLTDVGGTYANREKIEIERIIKNARPQGANGRKGIISDN